jgi:hypothetical protein
MDSSAMPTVIVNRAIVGSIRMGKIIAWLKDTVVHLQRQQERHGVRERQLVGRPTNAMPSEI